MPSLLIMEYTMQCNAVYATASTVKQSLEASNCEFMLCHLQCFERNFGH